MQEKDTKILNYIMQNCEMGAEALAIILEKTPDTEFAATLRVQSDKYNEIMDKTREYIKSHGGEVKPICKMQKLSADMMINIKTALDDSIGNIAEMLIQGTNMGIIKLNKILNENEEIAPDLLDIINDLLEFNSERLEKLKKYL